MHIDTIWANIDNGYDHRKVVQDRMTKKMSALLMIVYSCGNLIIKCGQKLDFYTY
jgi:hypothetical protein